LDAVGGAKAGWQRCQTGSEGFIRLIDTAMCHYKQKLIDTDMSRFNLKRPRSLLS
jgi:hypothetical protein